MNNQLTKLLINIKVRGIRKEAIMVSFQVLSWSLFPGAEENHDIPKS
jgi:hypothetical protein